MSKEKKFLDYEGVKYLWSKINMQDYPNNQTLIDVINAIDETKANKEDIVSSNWNAAEGQSGHVLNRTHWVETVNPVFDGDLTGREYINLTGMLSEDEAYIVKVSPQYISMEELRSSAVAFKAGNEDVEWPEGDAENVVYDATDIFGIQGTVLIFGGTETPMVLSLPNDVNIEGLTLTSGTWFMYIPYAPLYIKSLSCLKSYEAIHKLDNKFIDAEWMATKTIGKTATLLSEKKYTMSPMGDKNYNGSVIDRIELIEGAKYVVSIDGEEYITTCHRDNVPNTGTEYYYLGNPWLYNGVYMETLDNFAIIICDTNSTYVFMGGNPSERNMAIYEYGEIPNKLPEKFLPTLDWNKESHIKNRTHYIEKDKEVVTILPLADYINENGWFESLGYPEENAAIDNIAIIPNKEYIINFKSTEYKCSSKINENGNTYLGNIYIDGKNDSNGNCIDTGEPFYIETYLIQTSDEEDLEQYGNPVSIGITTTKDSVKQLDDKYLKCLTTESAGNTLNINKITDYPHVTVSEYDINLYKISDEVPESIYDIFSSTLSSPEPNTRLTMKYYDDGKYAASSDIKNETIVNCLFIVHDDNTSIGNVKLLGSGIYLGVNIELKDQNVFYRTIKFENHEFKKYVVKEDYLNINIPEAKQSDWNQNDETQIDYVKNRTHWIEDVEIASLKNLTFTTNNNGIYYTSDDAVSQFILTLAKGQKVKVIFDGVEYVQDIKNNNSLLYVGNSYLADLGDSENTGEPFALLFRNDTKIQLRILTYDTAATNHTISLTNYDAVIHKLDEKYLPDYILANSDWNATDGENGYIKNRTHYIEDTKEIVVPEGEYSVDSNPWITIENAKSLISDGDTCYVTYNGILYERIAKYEESMEATYVGNLVVFDYGEIENENSQYESNGDNFCFLCSDDGSVEMDIVNTDPLPTSINLKVEKLSKVIHKLDNKYIPCMTTEDTLGKTYTIDNDLSKYPSTVVGKANGIDIIAYRISEDIVTDVTDATYISNITINGNPPLSGLICEINDTYIHYNYNNSPNNLLWLVYGDEINGVKVPGSGIYVGRKANNSDNFYMTSITFPNHKFKKPIINYEYMPKSVIESRTHWTDDGIVTLFTKTTLTIENSMSGYLNISQPIIKGRTYFIRLDGVTYERVATYAEGIGGLYLGSDQAWYHCGTDEYDSSIPSNTDTFCIAYYDDGTCDISFLSSSITSATLEIKGTGEIVHQLPKKYLPEIATIQPNMTQNDYTKPDYIRHRTHWAEYNNEIASFSETYTIDSGVLKKITSRTLGSNLFNSFNVGTIVKVLINNVEYICEIKSNNSDEMWFGNGSLKQDWSDTDKNTGEPFCIQIYKSSSISNSYINIKFANSENYTIYIATCEPTYHKLSEKYLPESVDSVIIRSSTEGSTKKFKLTIDDTGTISATEI